MATWAALAAATSSSAVSRAVASGAVVQGLPRVLLLPDLVDDPDGCARAAVAWAGQPAQLSHLSALRRWGLPVPSSEPATVVHLLVASHRRRRTKGEHPVRVALHRTRTASRASWRGGLPVVSLERAVMESWPLLRGSDQRAPALVAVRKRWTTAEQLRTQLGRHPRLPGRSTLASLLDALDAGCRSELELWGYESVFTGPRLEHLERQVEVRVGGRAFVLDCFDRAAMLAIELDGRQYHDAPEDRERDLARDALVAELGVLTVRYPHRKLTRDPTGCREQALRLIEVRRRQLG